MKIVASLIESDKEEPDDRRTFEELKQNAFSIYNHVQFNTDSPSSHQEGMCPVLDLQMFVGVDGTIMYKFYEKPCASKFVISEMSAHSKQMKMSVLVEEGMRRMKTVPKGWIRRRGIIEEWARKLRRSGYPATVRHQVVKEALTKYEKMCKVEEEGGRPVHRAREWQQSARRMKKEL